MLHHPSSSVIDWVGLLPCCLFTVVPFPSSTRLMHPLPGVRGGAPPSDARIGRCPPPYSLCQCRLALPWHRATRPCVGRARTSRREPLA
jgi:hypothetical protein